QGSFGEAPDRVRPVAVVPSGHRPTVPPSACRDHAHGVAVRLSGLRARTVVASVAAVVAQVLLNLPIRDWQDRVPVAASAIGVTVAGLAGAFGGVVAGIVGAGVGWALNAIFVADGTAEALIALPAWLVAGAVAGWLGTRLRQADSAHAVDLRAAAERAGETEAKYRSLTEVLPLAVYVRSESGRPLFFSSAMERLAGYSGEECVRDPSLFLRLVHPDDRDRAGA